MADMKMMTIDGNNEIILSEPVDKEKIKAKIYEIRGIRVMLDSDIAAYFGVSTGNLNKAMKRNIKRFPPKFCFQISRDEYKEILRFQFGTLELEQGQYSKYLPYVYSEHGVAMLTSCLHTDRAISASIQIIEAFVELTHIVRQNSYLISKTDFTLLENKTYQLDERLQKVENNMITKSDLNELISLFDNGANAEEILILDGQPFKADLAYQKIYEKAEKNIIVIDDYLGLKTLQHLASAKKNIPITIISDNKGSHPLRKTEYDDFRDEYPNKDISFLTSADKVHDRYIILDRNTPAIRVYHCGASSKDAGKRITTITEIKDITYYENVIQALLANPILVLR